MATIYKYRHYFQPGKKAIRYCLEIITGPSGDYAEGGDTEVVVDLPAGFWKPGAKLEWQYEKLPMGPLDTPTLQISVNFGRLIGEEYDPLRAALMMQDTVTRTLYHPEDESFTVEIGEYRRTATWKLFTDRGRAAEVNPFRADGLWCLYVGMQRDLPSLDGNITNFLSGGETVEINVTLIHALRYAMEELKAGSIRDYFLLHPFPETLGYEAARSDLIDVVFQSYDYTFFVGEAKSRGEEENIYDWTKGLRINEVWRAIRNCTQFIYRDLLHDTTIDGFNFWGRILEDVEVSESGFPQYLAPVNHLRLFRPDISDDTNDVLGTGQTKRPYLPDSDPTNSGGESCAAMRLYCPAHIWLSTGSDDPEDYVGGLLHDDGAKDASASLFKVESIWEYVCVCLEAWGLKMQIKQWASDLHCLLYFTRIKDNHDSEAWNVNPGDLIKGSLEFSQRRDMLRGCDVAIPGLGSSEIVNSGTDAPETGTSSEERRPFRAWHNTNPLVGLGGVAAYYDGDSVIQSDFPDDWIGGKKYAGVVTGSFNPFGLFFFYNPDTTLGGGGQVWDRAQYIRPHSEIGIDDGLTLRYPAGARYAWESHDPYPSNPALGIDLTKTWWWGSMIGKIRFNQRDSCLPVLVSQLVSDTFGHSELTHYKFKVNIASDADFLPYRVGDFASFGTDLNDFVATHAPGDNVVGDLSFLPCNAVGVVRYSLDIDSGVIEVEGKNVNMTV